MNLVLVVILPIPDFIKARAGNPLASRTVAAPIARHAWLKDRSTLADLGVSGHAQHDVGVFRLDVLGAVVVFLIAIPVVERVKDNGVAVLERHDWLVRGGRQRLLRGAGRADRQLVRYEAVRD